jgi:hypothetical protein
MPTAAHARARAQESELICAASSLNFASGCFAASAGSAAATGRPQRPPCSDTSSPSLLPDLFVNLPAAVQFPRDGHETSARPAPFAPAGVDGTVSPTLSGFA